jgi:putative flippase GtrA
VQSRAGQPIRFLIVGAAGYGVNIAVFSGLVGVDVEYITASIASYAVSNALMYLGNRYFTFGLGHAGFWAAYLRYMIVGVVVVGLNAGVLAAIVEGTSLDVRIAQAISLLVVTPVAFVLFKRWTFQLRGSEQPTSQAVVTPR